jgi:hypothetical protein
MVHILIDPAGNKKSGHAEAVTKRKIDYIVGCDRDKPARFNTHRAFTSLGCLGIDEGPRQFESWPLPLLSFRSARFSALPPWRRQCTSLRAT